MVRWEGEPHEALLFVTSEDAVHVEVVGALTSHQRVVVIIAGHLTGGTAAIKFHPADATILIIGRSQPF
jgi:hypothetical protein